MKNATIFLFVAIFVLNGLAVANSTQNQINAFAMRNTTDYQGTDQTDRLNFEIRNHRDTQIENDVRSERHSGSSSETPSETSTEAESQKLHLRLVQKWYRNSI